jgi:hypothetical protein
MLGAALRGCVWTPGRWWGHYFQAAGRGGKVFSPMQRPGRSLMVCRSLAGLCLWLCAGCGSPGGGAPAGGTGGTGGMGVSPRSGGAPGANAGGSAGTGGSGSGAGTGGSTAGAGGASGADGAPPAVDAAGGALGGQTDAPPGAEVGAAAGVPTPERGKTSCLNADGLGGADTYGLITGVLGPDALDNFPDDMHTPPMRHVREDIDDVVGPHFVFLAHRDIDRDHLKNDRQRIEITVHAGGPELFRALEGQTVTYTWRFKFAANLKVSGSFGHFFQLKSEGGNWSAPIVTLSANPGSFEIHQIDNGGTSS